MKIYFYTNHYTTQVQITEMCGAGMDVEYKTR